MENSEQAQEAYELARERIAAAKEGGEGVLCLSPRDAIFDGKTYPGDKRFEHLTALPSEIAGLSALQSLGLEGTQVANIAPLARLTALQSLNLQDTQVADIAPLAELSALRRLNLAGTQVADIAPLAGLTALRWLDLWGTQVADIAPLAGMTALDSLDLQGTRVADIAPLARLENLRTLYFKNIPAVADPELAELLEIKDHEERTRRTLAYLRGEDKGIGLADGGAGIKAEAGKFTLTGHDIEIVTSEQVRTVQQSLADAGFDPGAADGIVGPKTQQAMQAALKVNDRKSSGDLLRDFNELKDLLEVGRKPKPKPKPKPKSKPKPKPKPKPQPAPPPPPDETAPFYSDQPATQDLLNRRAVAATLGTIVDEVWTERRAAEKKPQPDAGRAERDRTFVVHLHGRWGSGKTSILNFLREELLAGKIAPPEPKRRWLPRASEPPWVIVDYNAWRNQDIGPAWWTLMDTVYRASLAPLFHGRAFISLAMVWFGHKLWQLRSGWLPVLFGIAIFVAAIYTILVVDPVKDLGLEKGSGWGDILKAVIGVIGLLGPFLLIKSEAGILNTRTAKRYLELTRDPLGPLTRRYEAMIGQIGRPVAVFIDDLDRCDAKFVVDLLQNIQTLYRSAPVLYVVAADRGWICTSYDQVYQPYCEPIAEPGHSLGHMFLEKIFQLSIEVPSLGGAQRKAFWGHLLQTRDQVTPEDREAIDAQISERLEKATTEQAVIDIVEDEAKHSPQRGAIAGAQAFKRMQSKELVGEREHFLAGYADLLEANPRAMKRLLNAYGFRRGFDIQSPDRSDRDALVRWTILENRWPILADHLAGRSAGRSDGELMDALMKTDDFRRVADGLTWEKLRTIAGAPSRSQT